MFLTIAAPPKKKEAMDCGNVLSVSNLHIISQRKLYEDTP